MHILYKITYIPHVGTKYPKYYIGSKYNYTGNYFGSVASKQVFEFTDGLTLKEWWKREIQNTKNLEFDILESFDDITPEKLVLLEKDLHLKLNVLSEEYFNQSIATEGFYSRKKTKNTKMLMSKKTKEYWNSEEGYKKKQRLIERNKKTQSELMTEKWKNPSEAMQNRKNTGRTKGAKDISPRKPKEVRKVKYKDMLFDSAVEAAKYIGIDPVNIRRRCRIHYMNEWSYE